MPSRVPTTDLTAALALALALTASPARAGEIVCDLADHRGKAVYLSGIYPGDCRGLVGYDSAFCEGPGDLIYARDFAAFLRTEYGSRLLGEAVCTVFQSREGAEEAVDSWIGDYRNDAYKVVDTDWKPQ